MDIDHSNAPDDLDPDNQTTGDDSSSISSNSSAEFDEIISRSRRRRLVAVMTMSIVAAAMEVAKATLFRDSESALISRSSKSLRTSTAPRRQVKMPTSPGTTNSLLSRASFANGDQRFYSTRDSNHSIHDSSTWDYGTQTPCQERDWDMETVRDWGGSHEADARRPSQSRHDDLLQKEIRRLQEVKRKDKEAKKSEQEMRKEQEYEKIHERVLKDDARRKLQREADWIAEQARLEQRRRRRIKSWLEYVVREEEPKGSSGATTTNGNAGIFSTS